MAENISNRCPAPQLLHVRLQMVVSVITTSYMTIESLLLANTLCSDCHFMAYIYEQRTVTVGSVCNRRCCRGCRSTRTVHSNIDLQSRTVPLGYAVKSALNNGHLWGIKFWRLLKRRPDDNKKCQLFINSNKIQAAHPREMRKFTAALY